MTGSIVILTTAHLDHDTGNNDPANLLHLCQSCHLYMDRRQHAANARRTRAAKAKQVALPFDKEA